MGLHHQETHGRVFRGIDARKHLEMHKRDSHGTNIKLNVPAHMKAAARPADPYQQKWFTEVNKAVVEDTAVATYTSVVYQTLSADFDGPIAGYTTLDQPAATSTPAAQSAAVSTSSAAPTPTNSHESAYAAAKSAAQLSTTVTSVVVPTSSAASVVSSSTSVEDGSNNKSMFLNAPATAAAASTASATLAAAAVGGTPISATRGAIAQDGHGMSTGAKAGLALGIIIALALAAGLLLFCMRRRRNPNAHQEIHDEKRVSSGSSLFGGKAMSEKRTSAMTDKTAPSAASTAPRLSLRPVTQFLPNMLSSNNNNKGGLNPASAAMSEKPKSMWERRSQASQNPFEDADVMDEKSLRAETPTNPFEEPEAQAGQKSPSFKSAHSTNPSLEDASKVETASAVAASAPKGPNNVHRVQLDFKPSMEDELELKSGQLVRMLHAYDDGWALCIRMDRSQQGVVPRTCLSKLPVKPRQGPAPQDQTARPVSPMEQPSTPTSVPARKPVPGQAM